MPSIRLNKNSLFSLAVNAFCHLALVFVLTVISTLIFCCESESYAAIPLRSKEKRQVRTYTTDQLLKSYLERAAFRHKVLSENMANVNTPGYKADEVPEATSYEEIIGSSHKIKRVSLNRTSSNHLQGSKVADAKIVTEKLRDPYEIKPNGNNVSISQQMTKLSQNQQSYNAALKAYTSTSLLFSKVLGRQ